MKIKLFAFTITVILLIIALVGCSSKQNDVDQMLLIEDGYEKVLLSASWSYNYENVEEVSKNSDIIAVVKVVSSTISDKFMQYGVLQTIYTVEVVDAIYGDIGSEIQIVMTGGVSKEQKKIYEIADDPLMNINDEYVIFAKENTDGTYRALSGFQGRYAISDGNVYSLNVSNNQVATANTYSNIAVTGVALDEFIGQIEQYIDVIE